MALVTQYPSAVAVLRAACTLHTGGDRPQHADRFVAMAQAADMLAAPTHVEIAAANAVEAALAADAEYAVWAAAIDEATCRRMDLDLFLQDFHASGRR